MTADFILLIKIRGHPPNRRYRRAVSFRVLLPVSQFPCHGAQGFRVGCGVQYLLCLFQPCRTLFKLCQCQCGDGSRAQVVHGDAEFRPCFEPVAFLSGDVHHGAMPGREVAVRPGVLHKGEVLQVRALAELIMCFQTYSCAP